MALMNSWPRSERSMRASLTVLAVWLLEGTRMVYFE